MRDDHRFLLGEIASNLKAAEQTLDTICESPDAVAHKARLDPLWQSVSTSYARIEQLLIDVDLEEK